MELINFAGMRPEHDRLERQRDLGLLYLALGRPDRALPPLEKYLRWYPDDLATRAQILRAAPRQDPKA